MPDNYQQQFNEDRARQTQASAQDKARQDKAAGQDKKRQSPAAPAEPVSFPWGMVTLAAVFDLIGLIPLVNLFSELLAGFIISVLWQKSYAPTSDPLLTFFTTKIIDIFSFGIFPSNIGIVVYAYVKKKAAAKISASPAPAAANIK